VFTGIIEGLGVVCRVHPAHGGLRLEIESGFALEEVNVGDSMAVNGACLTAVEVQGRRFSVDVAPETLSKSTLSRVQCRDKVNLERALRLGERLDGHLVTGHVDGVGKITAKRPQGNAVLFSFEAPEGLCRYMVQKGSVAVDGISLTINACGRTGFDVSVIPHTARVTTLGFKKIGDAVNIETDLIGKYIERFVRHAQGKRDEGTVDWTLLANMGFV